MTNFDPLRRRDIFKLTWLSLCLLLVCSGVASGQCKLVPPDNPTGFAKGQSLGIRLFSTQSPYLYRNDTGEPFYKDEPLESLRVALADRLREQLLQLNHFSSVEILPDDKPVQTDLVLEGEFTTIYQIYGKIQLMAYPVSRMAIEGSFKRKTQSKVFEFSCNSSQEAGIINQPKKQMHANIKRISESLTVILRSQT